MKKLKAVKRIAPNNSALNATPSLLVIASAQEEPEPFYMDVHYDNDEYVVSHYDAEPRKSRSCVLAMVNDGNKPSCTCEHCGRETVGDVIWDGFLWDATCGRYMPDDQTFVSVTLRDCLLGNRDGIILILKDFAQKIGFEFCELREYPWDTEMGDYTPIRSGTLASLRAGS